MPTANTYIPFIGNIDAPFAIKSGDDTIIPRSGDVAAQGDPRPGVMRWVLQLITPSASANEDKEFKITLPVPVDFDMSDLTKVNSLYPAFSAVADDPVEAAAVHFGIHLDAFDADARTMTWVVELSDVGSGMKLTVDINFGHSAVN